MKFLFGPKFLELNLATKYHNQTKSNLITGFKLTVDNDFQNPILISGNRISFPNNPLFLGMYTEDVAEANLLSEEEYVPYDPSVIFCRDQIGAESPGIIDGKINILQILSISHKLPNVFRFPLELVKKIQNNPDSNKKSFSVGHQQELLTTERMIAYS